ncbi:cysteine-rich secretory protein 3-like [Discoglossus pictus]
MLKMEWNEEAAIMASCSAKSCVLSYSNPFQRFIQNSYCGELKFMSTTTLSWKTVIQSFYKQSEHFDYQTGKKDTGPYIYYTQVVRYNSHQLGCAIAECNRSIPYFLYVCYYCPSFSIHKERPYEAGPPCSACPGSCDDGLCTNACKYEDVRPNCDILKVHCNCGDVLIRKECGATCYCNNNEIK